MTDTAISVQGLHRSFGTTSAVAGYDLEIPAGKVTALVGPNGAGKTTLLLILAGLLAPDAGTVRVAGLDPVTQPLQVHGAVGWMPDFFGVYEGLTAKEYLELFAAAYAIPAIRRGPRALELLEMVDLIEFASRPVHILSRGQKQRLGFARVLVHKPKVLLLDEPASGLDPRARVALRDLVRVQASDGVGILISSHILSELEEMADLVAFMDAGVSRGVYPIDQLPSGRTARRWRFRGLDQGVLGAALTRAGVAHEPAIDGSFLVEVGDATAVADLLAMLVGAGVRVTEASAERSGLESVFMAMEAGT